MEIPRKSSISTPVPEYRYSKLSDLSDKELGRLKSLSYGQDGTMWYTVNDWEYSREDRCNHTVVICRIGKKIMGWSVITPPNEIAVYVSKRYRRLGIGTQLSAMIIDKNKSETILCQPSTPAGVNMYKRVASKCSGKKFDICNYYAGSRWLIHGSNLGLENVEVF